MLRPDDLSADVAGPLGWSDCAEIAVLRHAVSVEVARGSHERAVGLIQGWKATSPQEEHAATELLGLVQMRQGSPDQLDTWRRVVALAPTARLRTRAAYHAYRVSQDTTWLESCRESCESDGWGQLGRGILALHADDNDTALVHVQRATSIGEASGDLPLQMIGWRAVGFCQTTAGRIADAISALETSIALTQLLPAHPCSTEAYENLVELLVMQLRTEEAVRRAQSQLDAVRSGWLSGDLDIAAALLALQLVRNGRVDDAWRNLQRYVGAPAECHPFASFLAAMVAVQAGRPECAASFAAAARAGLGTPVPTWMERELRVQLWEIESVAAVVGGIVADPCFELHDDEQVVRVALHQARCAAIAGDSRSAAAALTLVSGVLADTPVIRLMLDELRATARGEDHLAESRLRIVERRWDEAGRPLEALRAAITRTVRFAPPATQRRDLRRLALRAMQLGAQREVQLLQSVLEHDGGLDLPGDRGLFRRLSAAHTAMLVEVGTPVTFEPGEELPSHDGMLLLAGRAGVYRDGSSGRRLAIAIFGPGDPVHIHAMLGMAWRAYDTVVALDRCTLLAIPGGRLKLLLETCPEIRTAIALHALEAASEQTDTAARTALSSVPERLARVLIDLDARYGRDALPSGRVIDRLVTQEQLAELMGCSRKSVTRALQALEQAGLIRRRARRIMITDTSQLADLQHAGSPPVG